MLVQFARTRAALLRAARNMTGAVGDRGDDDPRHGRSSESVEALREAAKKLPGDGPAWWPAVDAAIERYENAERRVGYFVTRPAEELLALDDVTRGYAWSTYHAVPGVLTSLGLLGTFVAILLGLGGLSMENGTVSGLDGLISSLSGKFLTSIVALGLSVAFLLVELLVCQRGLRAARDHLAGTVSRLLPYLSPSRVLLVLLCHKCR